MKVLVNYSHPLIPETLEQIKREVGDDVREVIIPAQIDFSKPIKPQLDALVAEGQKHKIDLLIPPALSYAAAYVTARLSCAQSDAMLPIPPNIVVLKRDTSSITPKFVLAEIVRG